MAKKNKKPLAARPSAQDKPATLKDMLSSDVLAQLKAAAQATQAEQDKKAEEERARAAEARKAEQARLDNDFEYLLNNSKMDWQKHK
ncbi:YqkE family protein [Paenibacillus massiliensis]|uniref:YqkE family protein n=1 Tax=Paenibacillus massiliensis TaxID=225917 RepID=UPI0003FC7E24|nr:YqkE family protein [Paenibacillus massiliensis]